MCVGRWDERVDQRMLTLKPAHSPGVGGGGVACCQKSGAWEKERGLTKICFTSILFGLSSRDSISAHHLRGQNGNLEGLCLAWSAIRKRRPQQSLLVWQGWLRSGQASNPMRDAPRCLQTQMGPGLTSLSPTFLSNTLPRPRSSPPSC